ncbi:MAG TPA: hypothetical protein DD435_04645 [Cyanobacteria bacterium UBA8530]|nr:hypothetical protein [Cyanobacteria bacterium UBA8530]
MKFRKSVLLAFSIGLGLTGFAPAQAATDGEQRIEHSQNMSRGTGGYWLEDTTKTFRYKQNKVLAEAQAALTASLGHVPTSAELKTYLDLQSAVGDAFTKSQIATALSRPDLDAMAMFDDPALRARAVEITQYYEDLLGRRFDDAGLQSWVNSGLPLDQVKAGFLNSVEYAAITQQRAATASQILPASILGALAADIATGKTTLAAVTAAVTANRAQIASAYTAFLGRAATAAEMTSALERIAMGTSFTTIYNEVYASSATARVAASFPGMPISAAEAAKIATLSSAAISNIKPPANMPGESVYPAGLFGRDAATWQGLLDGGWSWTCRIALVNRATNGAAVPARAYNFDELMNFAGWVSTGWWTNNAESTLTQNLGGVYQVINAGSNPKIAPVFQTSPGAQTIQALLWGSSGSYVDTTFPGGLDKTVAYFMEEGARYLDMYKSFNSVGATVAAAEAKSRSQEIMAMLAGVVSDPLVLDLNANGKIDVTGKSSARIRNKDNTAFVKTASVKFDLYKSGKPVSTEWIKDGDAFLVDDTNGMTSEAIASGKALTGVNLFGDVDGYAGGFYKLIAMDRDAKQASLEIKLAKGFGVLKGDELNNLKLWIDNGDGVAKADEIKPLSAFGITEIGLKPEMVKQSNGELFEQSYFIRNGQKHLMQEVWFSHE